MTDDLTDDLPPLVDVDTDGNVRVDLAGAIEHIPDQILTAEERPHAMEQVRQRVGQMLAETAARDLADQILAVTNPEPDTVETAGGEAVEIPPEAAPPTPGANPESQIDPEA